VIRDGEGPTAQPETKAAVSPARGWRRLRADAAVGRVRRGRESLVRLFDQESAANRRLTMLLGLIVGGLVLSDLPILLSTLPAGIDFEIPLRAASHWSSGMQAYPPSAMLVESGPNLPYLYPPFLLPLLSPIAALPRTAVTDVWLAMCLLCAIWTCRRLGIPWIAVPFLLAWQPFAEGLITGNVQIFSFAAFVALLYVPGNGPPQQREFRPPQDLMNGIAAAGVGVLKTTQLLPALYLARRRFRAAAMTVAVLAAVVLVMLPLTGIGIYGDWLAQLRRATDPAWTIGGVAFGRRVGIPDILPVIAGTAMALSVRGRDSAAWLGIALLIATPSVHGYTFLFLLPGLLTIRRDVAIPVSALFLGIYDALAWWAACLIVACLLIASARWTWLRLIGQERQRRATDRWGRCRGAGGFVRARLAPSRRLS